MYSRHRFRVWLKDCSEYATPDNITDIMNEYCFVSCFDNDHKHGCMGYESGDRTDVIIEQCTGLKDKNGVLIYEGDIVNGNGETLRVVWGNDDIMIGTGWGLCKSMSADDGVDYCLCPDWVVIGNIHENPKLMEV